MRSLYDAIGGEPAIRAIVQALYDRIFADAMIGFLFAGRDKARLIEHQIAFTCHFLGGPERYEGRPLPEVHAALPLLPGHFDRRHQLLAHVLAQHAVPEEVQRVWLRIDESLRPSILSAGEEARDKTRQAGG